MKILIIGDVELPEVLHLAARAHLRSIPGVSASVHMSAHMCSFCLSQRGLLSRLVKLHAVSYWLAFQQSPRLKESSLVQLMEALKALHLPGQLVLLSAEGRVVRTEDFSP